MILNSAEIKAFGKLTNCSYNFKKGINIVYGNNESGKTTVHRFIEAILFGFHKENSKVRKYKLEHEQYKPINMEFYSGKLEFSLDDKNYTVFRSLTKNKEICTLYDLDEELDITSMLDFDKVYKVVDISKFIGIQYKNFSNIVYISQNKPHLDSEYYTQTEKELINGLDYEYLSSILSNSINLINLEIKKIGNENRKKTSEYGKIVESIELLKKEELDLLNLESGLNSIIEELEILKNKKIQLNIKYNTYLELEDNISLKKRYNIYKQYEKYKKDMIFLDNEIGIYSKYANYLESDYIKIKELEFEKNNFTNKINDFYDEIELLKSEILKKEKHKKLKLFKYNLIALMVVLIEIFLMFYIRNFVLSFLFAIFSILICLILVFDFNKSKSNVLNLKINKIIEELDRIKNYKQNSIKELNAYYKNLGIKDFNEYKFGLEKKQTYYQLLNQKHNQIELFKEKFIEIENFEYNDEIYKKLSDLNIETIDIKEKIMLEEALEEIQKEINYASGILDGSYNGKRSLIEVQTDIRYYTNKKQELDKYIQASQIAIRILENMRAESNTLSSEDYKNAYNLYIKQLTKGKYEKLIIEENGDLKLKLQNDEHCLTLEKLSAGTQDQVFMAIRLGLRDILKKERNYPLIIDEAFVKYDDSRLEEMLKIFARDNDDQILIFTCSKREIEILERLEIKYNYIVI